MMTLDNSLMEVLRTAGPEFSLFFHESLLQFVPEEYRDIPLRDLAGKLTMPWGAPFPAEDVIRDANNVAHSADLWEYLPLWTDSGFEPGTGEKKNVSLIKLKSCEMEGTRPCVIICPGGGYENLAFYGEGIQVAERFAKAGIRPFILNYRFSPNRYPAPQEDLALAIKYVRCHAEELRINPCDLMIIGFSAGGHLCASTAALRDEVNAALMRELEKERPELLPLYEPVSVRPDRVVLCYPVISFTDEPHEPSFQALAGGDETLREHLSVEKQVDADYPKTFIWTNADDSLVPPSNTTRMGQALQDKNIEYRMRVYPQGEHGCSLAAGTSAEGWFDEMLAFMYG